MVTANFNAPLMVGQTGYTLICAVSGADSLNPMITYHWTRNGEIIPDGSSRSLNLPPLQLSQAAGWGLCLPCHCQLNST